MPETHRFVSEEDYQGYVTSRKPGKGDVLLTRVGAGIGEAATVDQDLDFAIYVSLGLVRPMRGCIFPDYITLWLNSPDGTAKSSRNTYGKGVSQGNLNLSLIRNFLVPLPPLAEQRRIVSKADKLMALVDALETRIATARTACGPLLDALVAELTTEE
jgi:type I restriction enzyme S subunit